LKRLGSNINIRQGKYAFAAIIRAPKFLAVRLPLAVE
jgi:hypothetical protein